jgi:hypothetical protein
MLSKKKAGALGRPWGHDCDLGLPLEVVLPLSVNTTELRRVRSILLPEHWQLVILENLYRLSKQPLSAIPECRPSPLALDVDGIN